MKKLMFLIAVLFFVANLFSQTGQVDVTVTGIEVEKGGIVKIGVYKTDGFPSVGKEITGKDIKVTESKVTVTIEEIPAGVYALAVFQDKDADGKLNSNLFGAPTEPYGFSKNKYGTFGPPDFEDVSFKIENGKSISLTINLE
ncbi:MAG: DUF2141 domain-containing protein [Bacteroidales bacterium]|nr:DUF2141 domain-containing protein [Bacteroidales bacterium]